MGLRDDANTIIQYSIEQVKPQEAVKKHLKDFSFHCGKLIVISIGKAGWLMAKAASEVLTKPIDIGIVITKHNHSLGKIDGFQIYEASHPLLDQSNIDATQKVLDLTENLHEDDDVIFLLSGGGSALFEKPICSLKQLQGISQKLLGSGADIIEINTIRKCLSAVKGGKFAKWCQPAHIYNYILSDVVSDRLDMIASGPTVEDDSTIEDALFINQRYNLQLDPSLLTQPRVEKLANVTSTIIGSSVQLADAARQICQNLGYQTTIIDNQVQGNNLEFANRCIQIAKNNQNTNQSKALVFTGETTVVLKGNGLGGRNQEIALACVSQLSEMKDTTIFSIGSDGTDGPTDAAGGYADNLTLEKAKEKGICIENYLQSNDSYHCLQQLESLIITGPTNTNVNDLTVILIKR